MLEFTQRFPEMARSDESNTRDPISQMLSFKLKDII